MIYSSSAIWRKISKSMRKSLLEEVGVSLELTSIASQIASGLREPGWIRMATSSGAARHALGRRGLLEVGQPRWIGPNQWHTPRLVTDLGRAVAEHGKSLLVYLSTEEVRAESEREHEALHATLHEAHP